MTVILLRDDDPNATTNPERLARAYAPLLDAGLPVSFSVIPRVALDTRAPDGARERFLDEETADSPEERALTAETPLVRWLRANDAVTDVFAHGLSHRRIASGTEFGALDAAVARERIRLGAEIFERALGRVPVGFVAPWDSLSRGSLEAATERFDAVSTGWLSRAHLPVTAWPSHLLERMARREALRVGSSWVLRHRGGKVAPSVNPTDVPAIVDALTKGADVAVVVLHHWMFWDHPGAHPVVCALARALKGRRVLRLRDVAQHLRATGGVTADDRAATSFA